jgi:hypothetical protein
MTDMFHLSDTVRFLMFLFIRDVLQYIFVYAFYFFGAKFLNCLVLCDKINRFLTFPCVRPIGSDFCLCVQTYTHLIPFIRGAFPPSSSSVRIFFFCGATARGGPWPPFQYVSKPLDPLLYLYIRLFPSFSGPWTRHPAISFLVFLCDIFPGCSMVWTFHVPNVKSVIPVCCLHRVLFVMFRGLL